MNAVLRTEAEALIQEQLHETILQENPQGSVLFNLGTKLPNMTSNQTRMPVLDVLPMAYWVDGDTGYKQTSKQAWDNVYLNAEELAVIVPIPENVLDDASIDIMGQVMPRIHEAIWQRVDSAVFFGVNRPQAWPLSVVERARQAGNNVAVSGTPDYYNLLLAEGGVIAKVEEGGYAVNGGLAALSMRAKLRGIRDTVGQPIFKTDMQGTTPYAIDGAALYFPQNGSFDSSIAQLIVGDFSKIVYAIRQDISVKILTESVIQDPTTKEIVYNLPQQDMIALRVKFRMGWALPNPATRMDENRTACPFAYLEPATPATTQTVIYTVNDGENAIAGARVNINGAQKKTNSAGVAVFNLRAGNYNVKVSAAGRATVQETLTVAAAAVDKTVSLPAGA